MDNNHHPPPTLSPLERLPLLPLEQICEYLGAGDKKRSSLLAFALASKHCCEIAERERFERLVLDVKGEEHAASLIEQIQKTLSIKDRVRYVRRAKVFGSMVGRLKELTNDEDPFTRPNQETSFVGVDLSWKKNKRQANLRWRKFAAFIRTLPVLKELVWVSFDQVPRCLLDVLHTECVNVTLHVLTFSIRSVYQGTTEYGEVDPDEYALISSPNLVSISGPSISVHHPRLDYSTHPNRYAHLDYNDKIKIAMARGLAPNLRSHCLWPQDLPIAGEGLDYPRTKYTWHDPFKAEPQGQSYENTGPLKRWICVLDQDLFKELERRRSLDSRSSVAKHALKMLSDELVNYDSSNLAAVVVNMISFRAHERALIMRFLVAMPPLTVLKLEAVNDHIIQAIRKQHGQSLKTLEVEYLICMTREIEEIHGSCPNLRHLSLTLLRKNGDVKEVALYKALGRFRRLESLSLKLMNDVFRDNPNEINTNRTRRELIDGAVDQTLVQAIFRYIFEKHRIELEGLNPSLQRLKIQSAPLFTKLAVTEKICAYMSRRWQCERRRVGLECGELHCEELSRPLCLGQFRYRDGRSHQDQDK
ncbi:hypothetical protein BU24DRAFT_483303 [Aaosphaeria arxii CBS 175.79]|uniref:Uncharacterized protein n=1 Tax=Aaosphaeria arxii CBS 175.79 TaxID=1450172 RepID=A0A6A5XKV4_9PLEO|nr:uncharacterized protein BU24DRAFT_483303 [Aaosphaeria arxii CBS 175.79]KAF2013526.1 hypothetical protein BU24DRAFT_483303 [Aaosphaeria arxii CBS 175.79]